MSILRSRLAETESKHARLKAFGICLSVLAAVVTAITVGVGIGVYSLSSRESKLRKDLSTAESEKQEIARNQVAADLREKNEQITRLHLEVRKQEEKNLSLLQELETDKHGGRELLEAMIPRNLQWSDLAGKFLEPLKEFKSQKVLIEYVPEAEPHRAASSLAQVLEEVGWSVEGPNPSDASDLWLHTGVLVQPYSHPMMPSDRTAEKITNYHTQREASYRSSQAANCITAFLKKRRWKGVRFSWPEPGELPAGTVRIRICTKAEPKIPRSSDLGFGSDAFTQTMIDEGEPIAGPVPMQRKSQRAISKEQRDTALETLVFEREHYDRMYGKILPVEIRCPAGNEEAFKYASQFAELLEKGGWQISSGKVIVDAEFNRRLQGVLVCCDSGDDVQAFFQKGSLVHALKRAGIEARHNFGGGRTLSPPQILVGW